MDLTRCPKLVVLTVIVLFSFYLAACGSSRLTQENFDKIHTGMTQAEVTAILGEPTESSSVDVAVFSGTASTWKKDGTIITIQFANGKVVAKQFSKEKTVR
ncbi:MAG: outer membrane protein assembly factor BamE [Deltaproteobacteria bacterium]|nr:MAG: outer membrane protein assembly factor BamE [Deltaproteobacteria bacterium]